jgi:diguanylate cyclase (GGDEF)-like protein
VILLTGDSNDDTDIAALEGWAFDFIDKAELGPRMLERAVRYALKMSAALARVGELAAQDELTKLPNRRKFDWCLLEAWQRAMRFQLSLVVVSIDLNHLKQINDTHVHPVGDEVVQHVAALLTAQIRQVDCVARIGGDEIALLLTETDLTGSQSVAARQRAAIVAATPCRRAVQPAVVAVTISTWVAAWQETVGTMAALIAAANSALYETKRTRTPDPRPNLDPLP